MDKSINKLAISLGEPAGIGPDLVLQIFNKYYADQIQPNNLMFVFSDPEILYNRAKELNIDVDITDISLNDINSIDKLDHYNTLFTVRPSKKYLSTEPGILESKNANIVLDNLYNATLSCVNHYCDGIVTCPINKNIINLSGIPFTGHTEYLAEIIKDHTEISHTPIMLLMGRDAITSYDLKVALITTHVPVSKINNYLNKNTIVQKIKIIHSELINKFNINNPKILITGLNPHAGENGSIGTEEQDIIIPAINELIKNYSIDIKGPFSADSIFTDHYIKNYDIIVALYHDQGLTGFKARCFSQATNITLGLPIIRTSVDHGTAIELAGTGKINTNSLEYSIYMANKLIDNKKNNASQKTELTVPSQEQAIAS